MTKVSLFHAGPPKTATTWLFHCLREHPQIITSRRDAIHYFDMLYPYGEDWYKQQFIGQQEASNNPVYFDPTYSYICAPRAPKRIYEYNRDAKIMVCLRDPIERAFSHYWHQKKYFPRDFFKFEDVLLHYNHFATWMEHGFVAQGLERFLEYFPKEQIYVMDFDALKAHPEAEYKKILEFSNLDTTHKPASLNKKVNVAGSKKDPFTLTVSRISKKIFGEDALSNSNNAFMRSLSGKSEYAQGVDSKLRCELEKICEPEIQALE